MLSVALSVCALALSASAMPSYDTLPLSVSSASRLYTCDNAKVQVNGGKAPYIVSLRDDTGRRLSHWPAQYAAGDYTLPVVAHSGTGARWHVIDSHGNEAHTSFSQVNDGQSVDCLPPALLVARDDVMTVTVVEADDTDGSTTISSATAAGLGSTTLMSVPSYSFQTSQAVSTPAYSYATMLTTQAQSGAGTQLCYCTCPTTSSLRTSTMFTTTTPTSTIRISTSSTPIIISRSTSSIRTFSVNSGADRTGILFATLALAIAMGVLARRLA